MPFKAFSAGAVLTAADVNDYMAEQAVITCTSATRPTPQEGMTIYETDTDRTMVYTGTAWVILSEPPNTIAAVVKQNNVALTTTTLRAEYSRDRDMVDAYFSLQVGSAGTAATELKVTPTGLPAPGTNRGASVGTWYYFDAGVGYYAGVCLWDGTDIRFAAPDKASLLGIAPSFAAANGDQIACTLRYRT